MIKSSVSIALLGSAIALASGQALAQRAPQDAERSAASRGGSTMEKRADIVRSEASPLRGLRAGPAASPEHPGGLYLDGGMEPSSAAGGSAPQRDPAWAHEGPRRGLPPY